eukprot:4673534-Prymnesium_polylepis.1
MSSPSDKSHIHTLHVLGVRRVIICSRGYEVENGVHRDTGEQKRAPSAVKGSSEAAGSREFFVRN